MPLPIRSEEHTSELQSHDNLVCRLLLEKKKIAARDLLEAPTSTTKPDNPDIARVVIGSAVGAARYVSGRGVEGCKSGCCFFFKWEGAPGDFPFSPPAPPPG